MGSPKVSILFPVYNGGKYLRYALESVLSQTFTDFEIEIMNDGSTDDSAAITHSYRDARIRYSEQPNAGISISLNRLLERSRGAYLARMDHDDWSHPERLEAQVAFLEANPGTVLVGTWTEVMDPAGRVLSRCRYPITASGIREAMLLSNPFAHGSVMFRRVPELGYRTEFDDAEDLDQWVRLATRYPVANLPRFLYRWRQNPEGISRSRSMQQSAVAMRVLDRYRRWYLPQSGGLAPNAGELAAERRATGLGFVAKRKIKLVRLFGPLRAGAASRRELWDLLRLPFVR